MTMGLKKGLKFVGIPGVFLWHYKDEIKEWLSNLPKYGPRMKLWAKKSPGGWSGIGDGASAPMVPEIAGQIELRILIVRETYGIVYPYGKKSEDLLRRHCVELEELYDPNDPTFYEGLKSGT